MRTAVLFGAVAMISVGCGAVVSGNQQGETTSHEEESSIGSEAREQTAPGTFGEDLAFLRAHTAIVLLSDEGGRAQVAVAPEYQGRVMTSTSFGLEGQSYGWIHRETIARGERRPHMNVFGGEDRFWLGPEGGQFSIYFAAEQPFDLEHWQVPEPIDWGGWDVTARERGSVSFRRDMELINYSGTRFSLRVERTVRMLERAETQEHLFVELGANLRLVAFESVNVVVNTGESPWQPDSGLLSIWILGMFTPSPRTTVVIPIEQGTEEAVGPFVNDAYFGEVPDDRLAIVDGVVFFRGDGQLRSKIGIPSPRALPVMGSYDADRGVLTIVQYSLPDDETRYVNSMWEIQDDPYGGDVVNSYNDGPPEPGAAPLGPFYELESSSPAAALAPGDRVVHVHRTIHLEGPAEGLDAISLENLGVTLDQIQNALPPVDSASL